MGTQLPPPKGHSPQFSAHICCGQMARWIKMPHGMEVGLCPSDITLDGDPVPPLEKGGTVPPPIFGPCLLWPNGWMHPDATWYGGRARSRPHCARWGPSSPPSSKKRDKAPKFWSHVYCGKTAGWIKMTLRMEVGLGSGHIVLNGDQLVSPLTLQTITTSPMMSI